MPSIQKRAVVGASWMMSASYLNMIVAFVGNVVLARILIPTNFGDYMLAASLLLFVHMLSGFGSQEAIIQNRDEQIRALIPTAFWISLGISAVLAAIATSLSLVLRNFYAPVVCSLIAVLAWIRVIQAANYSYSAILERNLQYKPIAITSTFTTLASFGIAGFAAAAGAGPWALAIREGSEAIFTLFGLGLASKYRLTLDFDRQTARWIWRFGWRMLLSRVGEVLFGQLDNLLVGTFLGTRQLGHYGLSYRIGQIGQQVTYGPISSIMFSLFSALQNSAAQLKFSAERIDYWMWRVIVPLGIVTFFAGDKLVVLIYGEKWQLAGELFRIFAIFLIVVPLAEVYKQLLIGSGNIDHAVRAQLLRIIVFLPTVFAAAYWGSVKAVAWIVNLNCLFYYLLLAVAVTRLIGIRWRYLAFPPLAAGVVSLAAGAAYTLVGPIGESLLLQTSGQIATPLFVYGLVLLLLEGNSVLLEIRTIRTAFARG